MIPLFNSHSIGKVAHAFEKTVVVTDDGHGWYTPGKRSFDESFRENEFNSIVEAKLMFLLDFFNIEHYQLAPAQDDTELQDRAQTEHEIVRKARAEDKKVLGISIHCDAFSKKGAHGFGVYYFKDEGRYSLEGKKFARCMADSIIESDNLCGHEITARHDNGIVGSKFYVLRKTLGTWILIENGFMTNDSDLKWLKDDGFRNDRTVAMFDGLYNYVKS